MPIKDKTLEDINKKFKAVFNQPLKFGDVKQIEILHKWRKEIDEFEENERAKADSKAPLIEWRIEYSWREYRSEYFEAKTYEEAEQMCEDNYGHEDDFEIERIEAVRK